MAASLPDFNQPMAQYGIVSSSPYHPGAPMSSPLYTPFNQSGTPMSSPHCTPFHQSMQLQYSPMGSPDTTMSSSSGDSFSDHDVIPDAYYSPNGMGDGSLLLAPYGSGMVNGDLSPSEPKFDDWIKGFDM